MDLVNAWNELSYFDGVLFTVWLGILYVGKKKIDKWLDQMDNKKLEQGSRYEAHDLDGDGIVTDEEIAREKEMIELELREEKANAQQWMAWVAMGSMLVFTTVLFLPVVSTSRVNALADLLGLFYIAQAGVVGAYMGVSAWMSRK